MHERERGSAHPSDLPCILALDLGTSAFKAGAVTRGGLIAGPAVVPYEPDTYGDSVTCPPDRYWDTAIRAIQHSAADAAAAGLRVESLGISSQAQTFVALDTALTPITDAIVWLDDRAEEEAEEASLAIADVAALCGFRSLSGRQFLPKVIQLIRSGRPDRHAVTKFLLLNEYIAFRLTGAIYGDETSQGMGGFYDITQRRQSEQALRIAGITDGQLAPVYRAAGHGSPLAPDVCKTLNLPPVPVFLCGNDQSCAAAGVDMEAPGSVLGSFGTAMVVYTRKPARPETVLPTQIAGIDPLTSRYFLLGLENECGNVLERMAARLYPGEGVGAMIRDALGRDANASRERDAGLMKSFRKPGATADSAAAKAQPKAAEVDAGSRGPANTGVPSPAAPDRAETARDALTQFARRFAALLSEVRGDETAPARLVATGGLSRSREWLDLLAAEATIAVEQAPAEHAGLLGIEKIVRTHGFN